MSDIRVPADSTGKRVDTVTLTDALVEVHRQKIVMTGASGTAEVVVVTNAAPGAGDMGLVVRQAGSINAVCTGTFNLSGTAVVAGVVGLTAGTANIGSINNISATVTVAGVVGLTAGSAVIGDINAISRTVQVAIGTPFTLQGISTTVQVAVATPFTLQGISTTVNVAIATPFTVNNISARTTVALGPTAIPSVSHGPASVIASTSASVTLVAGPGAGLSVYITSLAISNAGTVGTLARIGTSASAGAVNMFCASAGGGFVLNFDPPWKLSASEAAVCSVKPNSVGNTHFNVNFYVAT